MTDAPILGLGSGAAQPYGFSDSELNTRIRLVGQQNPWLQSDPEALSAIAQQPMDLQSLMASTGQQYGIQASDQLASRMSKISEPAQRALFAQLTPNQQSALTQMGYKPNARQLEAEGGGILATVMKPLSFVGGGLSKIPGVSEVGGGALEGLTWIGNWPGHLYRTIRLQDDAAQWGGLFGAVLGVAAVAAAPFTAGTSLGALAALGGGALIGGTLGSLGVATAEALTTQNPNDWIRAFNESWDGEKTFDRPSQEKVNKMLGDPRMRGLADDLAATDLDLAELAREMAGQYQVNNNTQLRKIEELAGKMATPGTAQYDQTLNAIYNAFADPTFQKAVRTLVDGKMSPGRDVADLFGLDPSEGAGKWLSGGTDAVFQVAMDPTLMYGRAAEEVKALRYTMRVFEGPEAAAQFMKVAARPGVLRYHTAIADAVASVERGGLVKLRSLNKAAEPLFNDLVTHARALTELGVARDGIAKIEDFTVDHLHQYFTGHTNLKPLLDGVGTVANPRGLQLQSLGVTKAQFTRFRRGVRALNHGLSDTSIERRIEFLAREIHPELINTLPPQTINVITDLGLSAEPWRFTQPNLLAYEAGRAIGDTPILGRVLGRIGSFANDATTMSISGKAIPLSGHAAPKGIRAFTELGKFAGIPSWARQASADAIMAAPSGAARMQAAHGYLHRILSLIVDTSDPRNAAFVEEAVERSKQAYTLFDDKLKINGVDMHVGATLNDQADMMVVPNLQELLRVSNRGYLAKKTMGVFEHDTLQSAVNKFWKPMVLLRIGFIPRAAGEELAAFMARGGMGSLLQESGARWIGRVREYEEATRLFQAGKELSADQKALYNKGLASQVPLHVRPVLRMMARAGFEDPAVNVMSRYGRWLATQLETGIGRGVAGTNRMAALERGFDAVAGTNVRALERVAGKENLTPAIREYNYALSHEGFNSAAYRANVADYADSIFLGNPYSLRRMLVGGVDDRMVRAGRSWTSLHATTITRETSAINASPIDSGYDGQDLLSFNVDDGRGGLRKETLHAVRGERQYVGYNDPMYENGVHENASRVLESPEVERALYSIMRTKGGVDIDESDLIRATGALMGKGPLDEAEEAAVGLFRPGRAGGYNTVSGSLRADHELAVLGAGRNIMLELVDEFDHENWQALLTTLRRNETTAPIAEVLTNYLPISNNITHARVLDAIRAGRKAMHAVNPRDPGLALEYIEQVLSAPEATRMLQWASELPNGERQFVAQFLHGEARAGQDSILARHKVAVSRGDSVGREMDKVDAWVGSLSPEEYKLFIAGDPAIRAQMPKYTPRPQVQPPSLLHETLVDAKAEFKESVRNTYLDPNMHDEKVDRVLRGLNLDEEGQYVDAGLRRGTVMLYKAPDLEGFSTFDDVLAQSTNHRLLLDNRVTVEQLLAANPGADVRLVANYGLAEELERIKAVGAGLTPDLAARPRVLRQHANVIDGRIHEGENLSIFPDVASKKGEETQLWHMSGQDADRMLEPSPDATIDAIDDLSEQIWQQTIERIGRRRAYQLKQRTVKDSTGAKIPTVYQYDDQGVLTALPIDMPITPSLRSKVVDHRGQPIELGATSHFHPDQADILAQPPIEDIMWEMVGPMMRDRMDSLHYGTRFRRKQEAVTLNGKRYEPIQSAELAPVYRAKVEHVRRMTQDDLPSFTVGQVVKYKPRSKFERIISKGFDKGIGPAVDAIARRPMAFHQFSQRYIANERSMGWLLDPEVVSKIQTLSDNWTHSVVPRPKITDDVIDWTRQVAHGVLEDPLALKWTREQTKAFLRSHSEGELQDLLRHALADPKAAQALLALKPGTIKAVAGTAEDPRAFINMVENLLPEGALESRQALTRALNKMGDADREAGVIGHISKTAKAWDEVLAMKANIAHIERAAGEGAAIGAIADVVPFLDSHEFKTMFADHGKGFLPFWYAEENFMKRWARGLSEAGPQVIRKAQLTYMGMKHVGVVRTDSAGKDWFVYPGSAMLNDAVSALFPGKGAIWAAGMSFQSPTDQMLPGMSSKFGTPSFNPLVTMPMELLTIGVPEVQPVETAMLGEYASGRSIWEQVMPAHLRNILSAAGITAESSRYASAQFSALAYLESRGEGITDDATAEQIDNILRKVRDHARVIVVAQALAGFVTPGSPSQVESSGEGTGVDPQDVLSDQFLTLVRLFGVEDGTAKFLELNTDATVDDLVKDPSRANRIGGQMGDIVNPLVYTTGTTESKSGAPIPQTMDALHFATVNADYMAAFPSAAPWLLPQDFDRGSRSQYAADQATISGLRRQRTSEEFLRAMKFKEASGEYFKMQDEYMMRIDAAEQANNPQEARAARGEMERELLLYRGAHPVFEQELESSDGRIRRKAIIEQMQQVINDPSAPTNPQTVAVGKAMRAYNTFQTAIAMYAGDRSARAMREVDNFKVQYLEFMEKLILQTPSVESFWVSVLRPESSL